MDDIIFIASVIAAIATILGATYKIMQAYHNIMSQIKEVDKQIKDNALHILKLAILEENMPPVERIKCGERYVALGGNGQIKKIYESLIKETEITTEALKKNKEIRHMSDEELNRLLLELAIKNNETLNKE